MQYCAILSRNLGYSQLYELSCEMHVVAILNPIEPLSGLW